MNVLVDVLKLIAAAILGALVGILTVRAAETLDGALKSVGR